MTAVRAFVSHSFTTGDEGLVSKFTGLFDLVAQLHPQFSWDRALRAEPRSVAGKVLDVFEDKNAFIGICTRRELVCDESASRKVLFSPYAVVRHEKLVWKTSDWMLQEIGLARGRGLTCILFVENDVRNPGALFGDIQYVPFDRDSPESSYTKFMEMVAALSPNAPTVDATDTVVSSTSLPPSNTEIVPQDPQINWLQPQADWTAKEYDHALFMSVFDNDAPADAEQMIFDAFLRAPLSRGDEKRWTAYREHVRVMAGKSTSLGLLVEGVAKSPDDPEILNYLALAYYQYDQFEDAAKALERVVVVATDEVQQIRAASFAALAYQRAGKLDERDRVLATANSLVSDKTERHLLLGLKRLFSQSNPPLFLVGALERLIELDPADNSTRFELAYKYSELGNHKLALYHYLLIPTHDRQRETWNNIGNSSDALALPSKAVYAYRQAIALGETLAMSNLANKFSEAGFVDEAKRLCLDALNSEAPHKNVSTSLQRAQTAPENEQTAQQKIFDGARRVSDGFKKMGRASTQPQPTIISDLWRGPDCTLKVSIVGPHFSAAGEYERPTAIVRAFVPGITEPRTRYRVQYNGTIVGRAIIGGVTRARPELTKALSFSTYRDSLVRQHTEEDVEIRRAARPRRETSGSRRGSATGTFQDL